MSRLLPLPIVRAAGHLLWYLDHRTGGEGTTRRRYEVAAAASSASISSVSAREAA